MEQLLAQWHKSIPGELVTIQSFCTNFLFLGPVRMLLNILGILALDVLNIFNCVWCALYVYQKKIQAAMIYKYRYN